MARVLPATDNSTNQFAMLKLPRDPGVHVHLAENGLDALQRLHHQRCDLAFMDVQLPEMDGLTATRVTLDLPASSRTAVRTGRAAPAVPDRL